MRFYEDNSSRAVLTIATASFLGGIVLSGLENFLAEKKEVWRVLPVLSNYVPGSPLPRVLDERDFSYAIVPHRDKLVQDWKDFPVYDL